MSFVSVACFRKEIPLLRDAISVISSQQIKSSILLLLLLRQDHLLYLVSSTISSLLSPCRCSRLPYHDLSSLLDIDYGEILAFCICSDSVGCGMAPIVNSVLQDQVGSNPR